MEVCLITLYFIFSFFKSTLTVILSLFTLIDNYSQQNVFCFVFFTKHLFQFFLDLQLQARDFFCGLCFLICVAFV